MKTDTGDWGNRAADVEDADEAFDDFDTDADELRSNWLARLVPRRRRDAR